MPQNPTDDFCFVSDSVQLAWIPEAAMWGQNSSGNSFEWTVLSRIVSIPSLLSNRTHNPWFVSSPLGWRSDSSKLEAMVTSMGEAGPQCLWSYSPFSVTWYP